MCHWTDRWLRRGEVTMSGIVHHLDLTVTDPQASFPLYDAVLRALGYELHKQDERGFDWVLATPTGLAQVGCPAPTGGHGVRQPGVSDLWPCLVEAPRPKGGP